MLRSVRSVLRCAVVRCGAVRCGVVRCGVVQCGVVQCGVVQCGLREGVEQERALEHVRGIGLGRHHPTFVWSTAPSGVRRRPPPPALAASCRFTEPRRFAMPIADV